MRHLQIPLLKGVVKDMHPRLIPDHKASDVNNIMFKEEAFTPRWGYATYGGNLPLNGQISAITLFRKNDGEQILCAFTNRDAYYFEQATGLWKYFTRAYSTGTASASGTSVTGSGTVWDTSWDGNGIYMIKFGDNDLNSSGTWYVIESIDTNTGITLEDSAGTVVLGNYVIRLRFTGSDDDIHSIAYPYDASYPTTSYVGEEDKIMVVANGVDPVLKWGGNISGGETMELLNNEIIGVDTPIAKYVNFFGSKGFGHTILSSLIEGTDIFPQRIEVSNAGFPTQWDGNQYNFYDSQDEIVGIKSLQSRMILYKSETMTEMWVNVTGGNDDPFDYNENKIRDIGTPSIRTVHEFGSFHIFLGWDNVYIFDGVSVVPIGTDLVETMVRESNRAFLSKSFALSILSENLYCLFIPTGESEYTDTCFVYNYREKFWTIWDFTHEIVSGTTKGKMTADGYAFIESSPIWSSLIATDFEVTGNVTSGSDVLTITGYPSGKTYADVVEGMQVIGSGIGTGSVGHHTNADALSGNTVVLTGNAISTVTGGTFRLISGTTWDEWDLRWKDLLVYEDNMSYLLGDSDGYIYNIAPDFSRDELDISGTAYDEDIEASIQTKDYPLNDPKHTIKICELVIGMIRFTSGSLRVRASVDFGTNWSSWVTIPNTAQSGDALYVEHIANFIQRGRQVRFQIENVDGADFEIESLDIGFNEDRGRISQSNI